ncbi:hypothetical protein ASE86_07190 [Sphingomonas sp. Leaf33]|uniref:hypothetical protein n=1 Tax=Sphingomonas sp. Leaf33 TaxID=1736215 RepID=UPI0006F53457|nr:hypothetical protein [Sphingomonas sp. Leaf33]KQN25958.1 hypothetical protein ASE86_07190 [Sphingomonas sp. Leaf33]
MLTSIILAAAVQAAPVTPAAQPTVQQAFDAAAALQKQGKFAEAVTAWEALEKRVSTNRRTLAVIAARKAVPLYKLDRRDEATAAARLALAGLPESDTTLRQDRYDTLLLLGVVARASLDYAGAMTLFAEAERFAEAPAEKLGALMVEAETAIFVAPETARAALDRADAIMLTQKVAPNVAGDFQRMRGLLLMNTGDIAGARKMTMKAVQTLGGLTLKIDQRDVQSRSDAAIAALLAGDKDEARRYMAFTGAGRLGDKTLTPGLGITPPDCGGEAGLKPTDVAVIQFTIDPDGSVTDSQPVYAAGGGAVALEFARAARRWSWKPEDVAALPPFYRYNVRVELRCSTAFERPSLLAALAGDLAEWLSGKGVSMPLDDTRPSPAQIAALRAALPVAGIESLQTVPTLYRLMVSPAIGREETLDYGRRALAVVDRAGAPVLARLAIALPMAKAGSAQDWRSSPVRGRLEAMLAEPGYAGDAQARAALRLELADTYKPGTPRAADLLRAVADDPALPAKDPLKVGALVRLASAEKIAGRAVEARSMFERSGLAASQCALVDKEPKLLRFSGEFPQEARRWGFEGWTQVETDIDAEGKALNTRVVAAYPPFVFSDGGRDLVRTARFSKTFRPDGGLGCGGTSTRVRFNLEQ